MGVHGRLDLPINCLVVFEWQWDFLLRGLLRFGNPNLCCSFSILLSPKNELWNPLFCWFGVSLGSILHRFICRHRFKLTSHLWYPYLVFAGFLDVLLAHLTIKIRQRSIRLFGHLVFFSSALSPSIVVYIDQGFLHVPTILWIFFVDNPLRSFVLIQAFLWF